MEPEKTSTGGGVLPAVDGLIPELLPDKDRVYYNDYSTLVQQQGMLQDHVRTSIYQFAMLENTSDFKGKTVLDVGAGTGILSFFAAKGAPAATRRLRHSPHTPTHHPSHLITRHNSRLLPALRGAQLARRASTRSRPPAWLPRLPSSLMVTAYQGWSM